MEILGKAEFGDWVGLIVSVLGIATIIWVNELGNKNKINQLYIPNSQEALNAYVEKYNKLYVIVSSTKWKMYSKDGISNIDLIYLDGGGCYFQWYSDN